MNQRYCEVAIIAGTLRLLTAKLWPELGDLLDGDQE